MNLAHLADLTDVNTGTLSSLTMNFFCQFQSSIILPHHLIVPKEKKRENETVTGGSSANRLVRDESDLLISFRDILADHFDSDWFRIILVVGNTRHPLSTSYVVETWLASRFDWCVWTLRPGSFTMNSFGQFPIWILLTDSGCDECDEWSVPLFPHNTILLFGQ